MLPPDPATALPPPTPDREPTAQYAATALEWVGRQHRGVRLPVWALLWWVLLPLTIVRRTNGSTGGMAGAFATFLVSSLVVMVAVVPAPDSAPASADLEDVDAIADAGSPSAGEADRPSADPSPPPSPRPSPSPPPSPRPNASPSPSAAPSPRPSPSPTEVQLASSSPRDDDAPAIKQGRVVDIVDGDTIDLADGTRVRLAIVDTPEVHGGFETCGPEASEFTGSFVAGETVAIYRPDGAPATDSFGRMLGEVVRVVDGASLNAALVEAGLGQVDERFTFEDPDLAERLRAAAAVSQAAACVPHEPAEPDPEPEPAPDTDDTGHTGNVSGGYDCHPDYKECLPRVGDLNCGDIGHQVELFGSADAYGLDADDDRAGCESEPAWSSSGAYPYY